MTEYAKIFTDLMTKIRDHLAEDERREEVLGKLRVMANATFEVMDEQEKSVWAGEMQVLQKKEQSLNRAIRRTLANAGREFLTAVEIRNRISRTGYDFSRYQSNPLVSVNSALNRMKPELEIMSNDEGAKAYRLRHRESTRKRTLR